MKFSIAVFPILTMLLWSACTKQPDACFTISSSNALVGQPVNFTSCAEDANSVVWDFGDGTTAEGNSTNHSYSRGGVYQVEMKAYSKKKKKWDRSTRIINVGPGKIRMLTGLQVNSFSINKPDNTPWDALIATDPDVFLEYGVKGSGNKYSTGVVQDAKINQVPFTWDFGPDPDKLILTDAEWFFQIRDSDLGGSELMQEFSINPLTIEATEPGKIVVSDQNNQITIFFAEE
jgi:hypothetical protein